MHYEVQYNIHMSDYWTNHGSKHKLLMHIIWCPKYRRKVLTGEIACRLQEILQQVADKHGWEIHNLEVMPDHVHLLIQYPPNVSASYVANQLKGTSSHHLRKEFKSLTTRLPTLWSRSYFVSSVGIDEEIIKKYIDTQYEKVKQ